MGYKLGNILPVVVDVVNGGASALAHDVTDVVVQVADGVAAHDLMDVVVDEHGVAIVVDDGGEIIVDYAVVDCAPASEHRCAGDVSYMSAAAMDTKIVQTRRRPMSPRSI